MPKRIYTKYPNKLTTIPFDSDWLHQTAVGSIVEHICVEAYGIDKATKEAESMLADVPERYLRIIVAQVFHDNSTMKFDGSKPYIDYISIKEAIDIYKRLVDGVKTATFDPPLSPDEFDIIVCMAIDDVGKIDKLLAELSYVVGMIRFRTILHNIIKETDDE